MNKKNISQIIFLTFLAGVFPFLVQATGNEVVTTTELPLLGEVDLAQFSLPVLAAVLGSIDGVNVCSIGALVLVLSIVLVFKKRSLIFFFGLLFLLVVALVYGFLVFIWYRIFIFILPYFLHIRIIIGTIALVGGLYLFFEFLRLRKAGLACKIGESKLIKKATEYLQKTFQSPQKNLPALGLAIILFAAIVTIIEFPCTAFLPLVFTGILAGANLPVVGYLFYISLYLFFYLLIELVIFLIAVFTKQIWLGYGKIASYAALVGSLLLFYLAYYYFFGVIHV